MRAIVDSNLMYYGSQMKRKYNNFTFGLKDYIFDQEGVKIAKLI